MSASMHSTPVGPLALAALTPHAIALGDHWAELTEKGQTAAERSTTGRLAALLRDERGLDLAIRFVDRVARPEDVRVASRELTRINAKDAGAFLGMVDQTLLWLGGLAGRVVPPVVVPLARARLRQLVGHLVVDARDPALKEHLAKARQQGFRLNINLLGEAVLGEEEAAGRTERVRALLARHDVDYVSIKVSSLVSQISTWDTEGTVQRCLERLRPLYREAQRATPHKFVNLDMEEYRDLDLTIELFTRLLDEDEFADLEAGIVLQAYLPDAMGALEHLISWAQTRRARGRAGIKIRLVKGANLAMEQVEAILHGWPQAPYTSKKKVDANFLLCIERALRPEVADAVRVGVASHNLYHVAMAHLLAQARGVTEALDVEMLQGMAPAQARAVQKAVGSVLLYTPVVAPADFDVAVAYLIRRLEENAAEQNYLHALFSPPEHAAQAQRDQQQRFSAAVELAMHASGGLDENLHLGSRRGAVRPPIGDQFANTPDSDPGLPPARAWARAVLVAKPAGLTSPVLASAAQVDGVVATAVTAGITWAQRPAAERAAILREGGRRLESRRGELVSVMAAEGGKTVAEADPEVSEAIDFARYYADQAEALESCQRTEGARFFPHQVTLVTPPWNFPVAIPMGGVVAALAAGSAVVIKPAHPTPGCVEVGCAALHEAGVPAEVLQVVRTADREVGKALVAHPDVDAVILTGSAETARLFAGWRSGRPNGPGVLGETSGKNALVITPAADFDLAVADLVRSAFGHAGQKCSAAALGILVGSVATSDRFRKQLLDAVRSLRVGWPQDLATFMGPIIEPAEGKLLRALTHLDSGERWLVEPRQLDDSGRLWSPGVKDGVLPGSFFHQTEVFGPVLGLMRARNLAEAIEWQNGTPFGLTGGLHSLDEAEIEQWLESVEVGNAYVNRHITGAIVRRQPFGGWKASVVGPGAKAGGPNYVAQLGRWEAAGVPEMLAHPGSSAGDNPQPIARAREIVDLLSPLIEDPSDLDWLQAALASDAAAWRHEFGIDHDPSALVVEQNIFRYRPHPQVWLRTSPGTRPVELVRLLAAGALAGATVRVSLDPQTSAALKSLDGGPASESLRALARWIDIAESSSRFRQRVDQGTISGRVRLIGDAHDVAAGISSPAVAVISGPVLATGRRELLTFLREQAVSITRHRFGHLGADRAK